MTDWHHEPITVADTETTGVNVREDRIVTGYVATVLSRTDGRTVTVGANVLINPGVPIPPAASAVHGIFDLNAQEKGCDPVDGVNSIAEAIARSLQARIPVVLFNGAFDLSMIHYECLRHDLPTLGERMGLTRDAMVGPIIDAHVLDKHVDPYRRGSRKLTDTAAHYGIKLENAHTADADAMAAARVAVAVADRYPEIARMTLPDLHRAQKGWRAEQMMSLQQHLRVMKGDKTAVCDPCWPICTEPTHTNT